jgi:hypothetical protein
MAHAAPTTAPYLALLRLADARAQRLDVCLALAGQPEVEAVVLRGLLLVDGHFLQAGLAKFFLALVLLQAPAAVHSSNV